MLGAKIDFSVVQLYHMCIIYFVTLIFYLNVNSHFNISNAFKSNFGLFLSRKKVSHRKLRSIGVNSYERKVWDQRLF